MFRSAILAAYFKKIIWYPWIFIINELHNTMSMWTPTEGVPAIEDQYELSQDGLTVLMALREKYEKKKLMFSSHYVHHRELSQTQSTANYESNSFRIKREKIDDESGIIDDVELEPEVNSDVGGHDIELEPNVDIDVGDHAPHTSMQMNSNNNNNSSEVRETTVTINNNNNSSEARQTTTFSKTGEDFQAVDSQESVCFDMMLEESQNVPECRDCSSDVISVDRNIHSIDARIPENDKPGELVLRETDHNIMKTNSYQKQVNTDQDLLDIDAMIEQSKVPQATRPVTKSKKTLFSAPFKKNATLMKSTCITPSRLIVADQLDQTGRMKVEDWIKDADEISLVLVYRNQTSQLRKHRGMTSTGKRNKVEDENGDEEVGYVMAISKPSSTHDIQSTNKPLYIKIKFKSHDKQYLKWARDLTEEIMLMNVRKICYDGQELIYELMRCFQFDHHKVSTKWCILDVKIGCWLLDPDHPPYQFTDVLELFKLKQPSPDEQNYNTVCKDLSLLGNIMQKLFYKLQSLNLWDLFINLEMRLSPILAVMEMEGVKINIPKLAEYANILRKKIHIVEKQAHEIVGHPFVVSSLTQLRQVLFEELKLDKKYQGNKKLARTQVNHLKSTSESVLQQLQDLHPLPKIILEHRQFMKLKSTYVDGILSFVEQGHLFTTWQHTAAATGRLTSANPNIQSIPKQAFIVTEQNKVKGKEDESYIIHAREPFISEDDWSFISADFQSIELRLLAHLSEDPVLLSVFQKADCPDIFAELASQWLNKPVSEIGFTERERTKRIVYSVVYGVGRERLADTLSVTSEEAKEFIGSFLGKFPSVHTFTKKTIDFCRRHGYVTTMFNRRRLFPHIHSPNFQLRSQAERQAVNFIVQGSAADICKAAMIQLIHKLSENQHLKARLLYQIHDELLLEVTDDDIHTVIDIVKSVMESSEALCGDRVHLKVPLKVSMSVGKTWAHMTEPGNTPD